MGESCRRETSRSTIGREGKEEQEEKVEADYAWLLKGSRI